MATYAYIRESCVQGVLRRLSTQPRTPTIPPPLDRIRAMFDGSFLAVNSTVSEVFAANESKRELLRGVDNLSFSAGDAAIPSNTLKKFIEDCTLSFSGVQYSFRRYPQWLGASSPQLGLWTSQGETLKAKSKIPVTAASGTGVFSSIKSPEIPSSESATFDAPDDFINDFVPAMSQYILGQLMQEAAESA